MEITVQVWNTGYVIEGSVLPPIGTQFTVHKHLTDGGTYAKLEVVGHEWYLEEAGMDENGKDTLPFFKVKVTTREIK